MVCMYVMLSGMDFNLTCSQRYRSNPGVLKGFCMYIWIWPVIPSCQSGFFLASTFNEPTRGSREIGYGTYHGRDGVTLLVNPLGSTRTDPNDAPMNRERRTYDQLALPPADRHPKPDVSSAQDKLVVLLFICYFDVVTNEKKASNFSFSWFGWKNGFLSRPCITFYQILIIRGFKDRLHAKFVMLEQRILPMTHNALTLLILNQLTCASILQSAVIYI